MKKVSLILSVILLGVFFAGCVNVDTTVKVNRDGSGQIIEKIGMSKEMLVQMEQMMSIAAGASGEAEKKQKSELFSKETFEKGANKLGEGVSFVSMSETEDGNMKYCEVVYAFSDINNVTLDQNQGNRISSPMKQQKKAEQEPIKFSFSKGLVLSSLRVQIPEKKVDESKPAQTSQEEIPPEMEEAQLKMMGQMFKGMHFVMKIECNGKIIKTNAANVDGNTITLLDIDFEKLLSDSGKLKELSKKKPEGIAELQEVLKGVEGIKFEPQKDITVQFK
jgi:PBP1b-binding outer membrane lipoprotein LpoB